MILFKKTFRADDFQEWGYAMFSFLGPRSTKALDSSYSGYMKESEFVFFGLECILIELASDYYCAGSVDTG
jgi:hypothetical protein